MADKGLLDPPMFQQSPKGEVDRVKQHVAGARLHHCNRENLSGAFQKML
jgi:hypothetical protein